MARKIIGKILFVLYLGAVAYLCFAKLDLHSFPRTWHGLPVDQIVHFFMFLPLPFLMFLAFHSSRGKPWSLIGFLILVIAVGMALGGGIELVQGHLGYRTADMHDFCADNIGTLTGVFFTFLGAAFSGKW